MRAQTYRWDQTAAPPDARTWTPAPTTGVITPRPEPSGKTPDAAVGDVTSKKRGSGARYNTEKPRADLLDLSVVAASLTEVGDDVKGAMHCLEAFRRSGGQDREELQCALDVVCAEGGAESLFSAAAVLAHGSTKYAPGNWCKGMKWSVVFGCAARHAIKALCSPDDTDAGSGQPHRAHLICNIMFLRHYYDHYPEGNDFAEAYGALAGDIE